MNQGSKDQGSDKGSMQHPGALTTGKSRAGEGHLYPATDGQRQLWYLYRLDPADDRYHKPISLTLKGRLDTHSLEAALKEIIERHAPLHSVFVEMEGELYQQEDDPKGFILEKRDLSGLPSDLGDMAAGEAARAFLKRPFDLEREPPIRGLLMTLSAESHILLLVLHHIQTDGGSYRLLVRELSDRYALKLKRAPAGDDPLPASALNWGAAEKFYLKTPDALADIAFWKEHLRDAMPVLRWPHPVRPVDTGSQPTLGVLQQMIPDKFREAIRPYADAGSGALLRLFLSTYAILLHRLTGQEQILIGLPVHDRRGARDRYLIGFRMKTLPVCLRISGRTSYRDIVRQLNTTLRMAYRHSRLPSGTLHALIPSGDLHSPGRLFHSLFNQREDMLGDVSFPGLTTDLFPLHVSTPKADLSVILTSRPGVESLMQEGIGLHYDRSVFGADDVRMLFDRWMMILRQCLSDPSIHVDEADILLPEENEPSRWLMESGVRRDYPRTSLHTLVLEMARRHPDRPAVVTPDGELGYGMLDSLSASLAAYLREQGVGRETAVGIRVGRGPDFVIACLAVLRAGGAILPVAPDLPPARVSLMLRDASAPLCLTDEAMSEEMGLGIRVLDLRRCIERSRYVRDTSPLPDVSGSRLAYIMYTSGSTGRPKGVMVEHRHILNRLLHTAELLDFGPDDRTLHRSSVSFDVWIPEVFLPLISGGTVVMPAGPTSPGPEDIADLIEQFDITYVHLVPGLLSQFLDLGHRPGVDRTLRTIWCGGESLPEETMRRCLEQYRASLYHGYGPTETAVGVACWKASAGHGYPKPPIGRPFANTILRVVDARGQRVPPGVTGELWIGGAQTGRGYVNDPSLTRARFVDDPLEPGSGLRFYRSGDLARFLPDGQLLFMGRADDQVKIRGQRVEPEEVSVALRGCPGVREALVMAEPDGAGGSRLRGWVTADAGGLTDAEALRRQLAELLPSYMIPWRIEVLSSWPLTTHGKVDRRALLSQQAPLPATGGQGGAPLEGLESEMAGIWCEVLGLPAVGRSDDFFSLGGHSLHALRVTGLLQSRLGLSVKLSDLYAHPRLSDLSALLTGRDAGTAVPAVASQGAISEAPMSAGQRRMWLLDGLLSEPSAYHVTRLLRSEGVTDLSLTERVLGVLVRRHAILRTVLLERDGELLQCVLPERGFVMPLTSESMASEAVPARLQAERMRRFALAETPAWRVLHIHTPTGDLLSFTFHHALTDEWSMRIFFTEYARLQSVGGDERAAGLPVQTHRYTDFGLWQSAWLKGAEAEQRRSYWRRSLADLSEVLRLSPDLPVTDPMPGRQGRCSVTLPASLREAVLSVAQREGVTPFTLLLGTWQILLYRLTGSEDILIGTPVSERRTASWQGVMGLFLNMVPVRMQVSGGEHFRSHIHRLRGLLESVMEQADLPYAEIASLASGLDAGPFHSILQLSFIIREREDEPSQGLLSFSEDKPHSTHAVDDMVFLADVSGPEWVMGIKYDRDRFSGEKMHMFLQTYQWLLEQMIIEEERPIRDLSLVTASEQVRLLELGLGRRRALPRDPFIHRLFERQAERRPEAIAIDHQGLRISYGTLNADATRWAGHLIGSCALTPGEVVALLLPQGIRHVTFVLAVMKAGAAVVPIDPELPDVRIRHMLNDCGARIVVTDARGLVHLSARHQRVDPAEEPINDVICPPDISLDPGAPAYGMYTSGTTGMPKGIFNTHLGFCNMIASKTHAMGIIEADRIAQLSTPSFDVSLFEIFLALHNGATVVIPGRLELSVLPSFIVEKRVSVAMLTPMVVSTLDTGTLSHLRVLMTGGEEARPADVMRVCEHISYFNIYGPTEVSVWSTLHPVRKHDDPARMIPIGRPMDNYFVCILAAGMQLLPAGMTGELYIGGVGLGKGYHGRPDLTSEQFVPSPFRPGDLLYRTGDLAWWNPQGELMYAGRKDGQVKVMGFRVELREVERELERLAQVRQAVVIPVKRPGGEQLLAGFVAGEGSAIPDDAEIRETLARRLPRYMLPDRIHRLPDIPLNHNGKVDRRRLLQLDTDFSERFAGAALPEGTGQPATATERGLSEIWASLLGHSDVPPSASFFALGGNSLQLIRLMVMIRDRWGLRLDVTRIYTHITLRSMAGLIDETLGDVSSGEPCGIRAVEAWGNGHGYPVFVMVGGAGSVEEYTKYHRIGEQLGEGYRLMILQDPDTSAGSFPARDLPALAEAYARYIRSDLPVGPVILLGDCIGGIDAYATACALQRSGVDDVAVVMLDTTAPGYLSGMPAAVSVRRELEALPARAGRLSEWIAGSYLWLHRLTGIGRWYYRVPGSRRQLMEMALAWGLFSGGSGISSQGKAAQKLARERMEIYLAGGWKDRQPPASGFNAARYRKQVPVFDPAQDDPVSHALLLGMKGGYARRRLMDQIHEPVRKSDIMAARTWLRREDFRPDRFRGRVILILSERIFARGGMRGWERHVDGIIEVRKGRGDHRSYLREHVRDTALVIRRSIGKILNTDAAGTISGGEG